MFGHKKINQRITEAADSNAKADIALAKSIAGLAERLDALEKACKASGELCCKRFMNGAALHDELDKRIAALETTFGQIRVVPVATVPVKAKRKAKK